MTHRHLFGLDVPEMTSMSKFKSVISPCKGLFNCQQKCCLSEYNFYNQFWANEWPFIPIHMSLCERTGKELPWSVMLVTRFTRVTPWMFNDGFDNLRIALMADRDYLYWMSLSEDCAAPQMPNPEDSWIISPVHNPHRVRPLLTVFRCSQIFSAHRNAPSMINICCIIC